MNFAKTLKFYIVYFILIVFLGCGQKKLAKNSPAPEIDFKDLDNKTYTLEKYKGKVILLHFWTDFCQSCRAEFPRMQSTYKALEGEKFELLAVNVGQPKSASEKFRKDFSVTFPMLIDEKAISKELYKVEAFPTNYFITPEGKILRKIVGWLDQSQIEFVINKYKK